MRMQRKKETTLIKIKSGAEGMGCVCSHVLELKGERLLNAYSEAVERFRRAKPGSKNRDRGLAAVLKLGNKARAIKEALNEINITREILEQMIFVEIKGKSRPRLSSVSDYRRSCAGKVKYREESAKTAVVEIGDKYGDLLEAYDCRHCDGWHVGHAPSW